MIWDSHLNPLNYFLQHKLALVDDNSDGVDHGNIQKRELEVWKVAG